MAKYPLRKIILRYNGVFDFDGLYQAVISWAKNYGYKWHEAAYKHKVPSYEGAEQEFKWMLENKVTEYVSYLIVLEAHTWEMKDVEVEIKGVKKNLVRSRIEIVMEGEITTDWQKKFGGSKFAKLLGRWYEKLMERNIENNYGDQLYYRMWNLHAIMKKYLDMQSKKFQYKGYLGEN